MRMLTLVLLLVCAGTSASDARESSDAEAGSKIVASESLWNQAVEVQDLKALNRILDDAFVYVDPNGRLLTKSEVLVDLKVFQRLQFISASTVVLLHGDTAVATGTYQTKGVERGKPFVRHERFVDTWWYKNGLWVAIASVATPSGP